ncbi:adaptin ear-binding coat-associated protein 2 [Cordyceps militaris CM01]|uniref:Adaptin ear-binding coat-associated protein 2 n=1 Tax=Cordyceps militaris (strain CM01) TaxID=983644 RepID=G3JU05_CORMM|nr:adaptin ear-binding coat-associated protein 2 [Cordyceps militaris CM01]EGX88159.1 adaptin ear-binding coat-associated protein 2 [Cordyceps militaris CM01]
MELLDPATGKALPPDAIQRVLFLASNVHVYSIPPMASMRGHNAASWTADPAREIFAARMRVVETSYDQSPAASASSSQQLKTDIVLEDPRTGQLFAACPYADPAAVEPAVDSARFFALTVRDEAGRKAVLGIGFEERPEAFDFAVALQEARKALGWEAGEQGGGKPEERKKKEALPAKDYSLKEGETITINIGGKFGRRRQQQQEQEGKSLQSFALPPPPPPSSSSRPEAGGGSSSLGGGSGGAGFALPPPPSAQDVKSKRKSLMEMGFDDGQFGEFA